MARAHAALGGCLAFAALATPGLLHAAESAPVVGSAFFIAKNENRNEVHFAVRVTDACEPRGPSPVYPYWRMRERGPAATEPLLAHEQAGYGIASQTLLAGDDGPGVRVTLRAMPDRPLTIRPRRAGGGCAADTFTRIGPGAARLASIRVIVGFLFRVQTIELRGERPDGTSIVERFSP